jgi:hypothetical protein
MVRGASRRIIVGAVATFLIGGWTLAATPASAAPKPKPTIITITGAGINRPITVKAADSPQLFAAVHSEVAFLGGRGETSAPKADKLGPKFVVVVHYNDKPRYGYELYPLAVGGPKAFRPAAQPDKRRTTAAWFFGRIAMSETLRAAGVPLPERPSLVTGGIGGGERAIPDDTLDAGRDLDVLLADLRRVLLLNAAVVVTITVGLAGIALLIRRRTR